MLALWCLRVQASPVKAVAQTVREILGTQRSGTQSGGGSGGGGGGGKAVIDLTDDDDRKAAAVAAEAVAAVKALNSAAAAAAVATRVAPAPLVRTQLVAAPLIRPVPPGVLVRQATAPRPALLAPPVIQCLVTAAPAGGVAVPLHSVTAAGGSGGGGTLILQPNGSVVLQAVPTRRPGMASAAYVYTPAAAAAAAAQPATQAVAQLIALPQPRPTRPPPPLQASPAASALAHAATVKTVYKMRVSRWRSPSAALLRQVDNYPRPRQCCLS